MITLNSSLLHMLCIPVDLAGNGPGAGSGDGSSPAGKDENFYVPIPGRGAGDKADKGDKGDKGGKPAKGKKEEAEGEPEEGDDLEVEGEEGEEGDDFTDELDEGEEGEDGDVEEGEEGEEELDENGDPIKKGKKKTKETVLRIAPEDLAALVGQRGDNRQQREEAPLTAEQIRAMVNPVEVTEDLVAQIGHEDPKVRMKALQNFANATVKNAYSLASMLMKKKEKEFVAAIEPLIQHHNESKLNGTKQTFYTEYKDLAKYDLFVKAAAEEVDGNGKSQKQIFREVAILARKKLQAMGIKIGKPQANHGAEGEERRSGVPSPNRFSSSGRSGGDQHSGKGKPNNADADIYSGR